MEQLLLSFCVFLFVNDLHIEIYGRFYVDILGGRNIEGHIEGRILTTKKMN